MARTKISEFSSTAADNTDIDGIDIAEGCAPSGINNAIRTLMADLKDMQTGASGDTFTFASLNATTANIDGGTIDGTTIGGTTPAAGSFTTLSASSTVSGTGFSNYLASPPAIGGTAAAAGTFTTLGATTGNITIVNATTVDTTNIEVTNIKAKDGTAAGSIADSTGVVTFGSTILTTTDINGGTIDGATIGGSSAAPVSATNLAYTGTLTGGTGVINIGSGQIYKDASGNVGIGTTSPNSRLTVQQATSDATVGASFRGYTTATADGQSTFITQYVDSSNSYFANHRSQATTQQFYVNSAEVARIDSSGRFLVGTTGVSFNSLANFVFNGFGNGVETAWSGTNSIYHLLCINGNGLIGGIQTSGSTTSFLTSSDYRLKENVQPMIGALATVAQLKPVTYTWKADGSAGQGFIAHELQAVVPDAVSGEKDAVDADGNPSYQGVDTSFLVATLTAAIQEQQAIIKSLQDRITLLEQAK